MSGFNDEGGVGSARSASGSRRRSRWSDGGWAAHRLRRCRAALRRRGVTGRTAAGRAALATRSRGNRSGSRERPGVTTDGLASGLAPAPSCAAVFRARRLAAASLLVGRLSAPSRRRCRRRACACSVLVVESWPPVALRGLAATGLSWPLGWRFAALRVTAFAARPFWRWPACGTGGFSREPPWRRGRIWSSTWPCERVLSAGVR